MNDMLTRVTLDMTLTELGRTCNALTSAACGFRATAHDVLSCMPSGAGEEMNRYWLGRAVETEALRERIKEAWAKGPSVHEDGPTPADEAEHYDSTHRLLCKIHDDASRRWAYGDGAGPTQIEAE